MPRARRPVNGPTVTQLLTPTVRTVWTAPSVVLPPAVSNISQAPLGVASGTSIRGLASYAPSLPAQFGRRTFPAVTSILQGNAGQVAAAAYDATSRAFAAFKERFLGTPLEGKL